MAHNSERHKNKLSSFVLEVKSVSSVSPSSPLQVSCSSSHLASLDGALQTTSQINYFFRLF